MTYPPYPAEPIEDYCPLCALPVIDHQRPPTGLLRWLKTRIKHQIFVWIWGMDPT